MQESAKILPYNSFNCGWLLGFARCKNSGSVDIHYALEQRESLEVYLQDPLIGTDNNLVENAIRPTALGKKNWLLFGDADAGERGAVIYSIIDAYFDGTGSTS
jgi:transposase IS66 family protein